MGNKVFGVVVFVLWASSMSWLMTSKVLPSYLHGDAPQPGQCGRNLPIGWRIELSGQPCGVSISQSVPGVDGVTEMHSRVVMEDFTLDKFAPRWLLAVIQDIGAIRLDMRTRSTLDTFGNLATISSRVTLNESASAVKVDGHVADGKLKLRVRSGDLVKSVDYPWRDGSLLGELSPEPHLIGAYVGQSWRSEVFSPFAAPHDPVEEVDARVVEEEHILFNGKLVTVRRIEYRTAGSAGVSSSNRLRSILWVAEDGRVLRQEVVFLQTRLRFNRLSDQDAQTLADDRLELETYATVDPPEIATSHATPVP